MSRVRPVERADLPAVAALYERIARSGTSQPPPGLAASFERQQFDHPWRADGVRSLLCETDDGTTVGFLAVYARRVLIDGQRVIAATSGPLVADPTGGVVAPGLQLTRAYLAGPQALSVTDGATPEMERIWTRAGGFTAPLASLGWVRILAPAAFAASRLAADRRGSAVTAARRAARGVDTLTRFATRRWVAVATHGTRAERLTPEAMVSELPALLTGLRLRPDYDEPYARWLLEELARVESRGELSTRLVRNQRGAVLGWTIAYLPAGRTGQVVQLVARPPDVGAVLDDLCAHARSIGVPSISGRFEPHLVGAVVERRCLLRRPPRSLAHSKDPEIARMLLSGEGFLSRADGEWWVAAHLERFDVGPEPRALRDAS